MRAPSRTAWRFGVSATATVSLVLACAATALADDTSPADTTPPVVTSTGLTDGQTLLRQMVLHPIATDDVAVTSAYAVVGKSLSFHCTLDAAQGISCPLTIPTGLNGTDVNVAVVAFDAAHNHGELVTPVHVVAVALSGTLTPKAGTAMRSGPMTATLSDVSPETTQIDMIDGPDGAVLTTLTAAPWTFTWNATETATPPCLRLSEPASNTTTYCSNYVVSDEAPVIKSVWALNQYAGNLAWSSRIDDGTGWIGAVGTIDPFITDKTGIDHTELWVDGVLRSSSTAQSPMFSWQDTTRGKTSANLEVRVWNRVGLTTTKAFRLNIDNTGPVLRISPRTGTLVRGKQLTVTQTATDQHRIAVPALDFPSTWVPSPLSYQYDIALHHDGPISLNLDAYDELGNESWLNNTVIVDNTAPNVAFAKAPKNNAHVTSTISLTAAVSDRYGIARVQLLINGRVVATSSDPHGPGVVPA